MCQQDPDSDPSPSDPLDVARGRMDQILRDIGLDGAGDLNTIKRRHLVGQFEALARTSVALEAQRAAESSRRQLDAAHERSIRDTRVIRALAHGLNFYADPGNWMSGCPVQVNAFDVDDVRLDWGEYARDALRSVKWAFPR